MFNTSCEPFLFFFLLGVGLHQFWGCHCPCARARVGRGYPRKGRSEDAALGWLPRPISLLMGEDFVRANPDVQALISYCPEKSQEVFKHT